MIVVLIIIAASGVFFWQHKKSSAFPVNIRSSVNFPLYYPTNLPKNYYLDLGSFSTGQNVLTFSLKGPGGDTLIVSEQPTPKKFDFQAFYSKDINVTTRSLTNQGELVIGKFLSRQVGSLVTASTWIIVSAPQSSPSGYLDQILRSLRKS